MSILFRNKIRVGALLSCVLLGLSTAPVPASADALGPAQCDFNGDGRDDLAVGIPAESIAGIPDMGAVLVMYGSSSGPTAAGSQLWHQDVPGIENAGERGDHFGWTVACGDFDNDGRDDLAAGAPGEDDGGTNAGAVNVIYGSATGLQSGGDQFFNEDSPGVVGSASSSDQLGSALTAGDFDGNGADDLAVGAPTEKVGSATGAKLEGAVSVLYGTPDGPAVAGGLSSINSQLWTQDSPGVLGTAESRDLFGSALTSGDFDGNGRDDLAIGVPAENVGDLGDAGAVNVLYGAAGGLSSAGSDQFYQGNSGVQGSAEARDLLGTALASGDFDGNGRDDLAIGVPGEDVGSTESAGAVNVLYGAAGGLSTVNDDLWHQGSPSIAGDVEPFDRLGSSLAAGDYSGNGRDDLAIGAPWDSNAGVPEVGSVNLLYGTASGLDDANNQLWHQNQPNVLGVNEAWDHFGESLTNGDYNGDGRVDLSVGVPGEGVGTEVDNGSISVFFRAGGGLGSNNNQLWHGDVAGLAGDGEPFDRIGGRARSHGIYRIGYANGAEVKVNGDWSTHSPPLRMDLVSADTNTIVAARRGTVMAVVDSNAEPTDNNNYIWIAHSDGEWSKYTHLVTGSALVDVGDTVSAGAALGTEGDVGQASGVHLHFEVGIPTDLVTPISSGGFLNGYNLDPVICGIPGQTYVGGQTYTAGPC